MVIGVSALNTIISYFRNIGNKIIKNIFFPYFMTLRWRQYNAVYSSDENGVLFNNDKTVLIKYPEGNKAKSYTVPEGVKTIDELSVHLCKYLEEIYIGSNVSHINVAALSRNEALKKIIVDEANDQLNNVSNYCCIIRSAWWSG